MRLKAISLIVLMGISLSAQAKVENSKFLAGDCRGPGGEGPKPMALLPFALSHIQPYATYNEVMDGLFLPLTRTFASRHTEGELRMTKLDTHQSTLVASVKAPMVRVRDAQERFLSFENRASVFDTVSRNFYNYRPAYSGKIRPLFWINQTQYSAVTSNDERNASFRIQRYRVGDTRARRVCNKTNFFLNAGYKLGEGHVYPNLVLHRTEKMGKDERQLTVTFLNVESCQTETKVYKDLMKGQVLNVYYFGKLKSLLIETDHPTQQLVWDTAPDDAHCHYYSLNQAKLLVVSYEHPIIGAFDPYDGLSLLQLHDLQNNPPKAFQVTGDYPIADMNGFDVELTPDKASLVGVTQLIDKSKTIIKIDVPKSYTNPESQE